MQELPAACVAMPALLSSLFARPLNKAAPESKSRATYERHSSVQAWRAGSHSRAAVTAQMQSTEVRRATQQVNVPVQGLPIQQREKLQPESPREHALSSPSDITASNRAYSVLVKVSVLSLDVRPVMHCQILFACLCHKGVGSTVRYRPKQLF